MLHDNLTVKNGVLHFAGVSTVDMAKKHGTPLMLIDENGLRNRIREYKNSAKKYLTENSMPLYASKALCFTGVYKICQEEGIGIDTVSGGEIYTALNAGFDLSKAFFHGNAKTDADIEFAIDNGVGYFVTDNMEELEQISVIAGQKSVTQNLIIRLSPGIDPHTHAKISTGKVDSKFGVAIETGQAFEFVKRAILMPNVCVKGFHCHIGSQIFESTPFIDAGVIMLNFIKKVQDELGFKTTILSLGGGYGVRYVESDPVINYSERICELGTALKETCKKLDITLPDIMLEPGRSLVADMGLTLYTVQSVKEITGYKNYVAVNGGMTDNPRYTLYGSPYTVVTANKMDEPFDYPCTVAGRCCESGDLLQENVLLAKPNRNDLIAVLVTGAYNYSMASNYNKVPRPKIVGIKNGEDFTFVRRETYADLIKLDE
ncbi:MAG: diaminopimelate decarboxylase [Clostridia bacterium]|nr:diaminopimelate decarboxylase [Clostridia bacterium]